MNKWKREAKKREVFHSRQKQSKRKREARKIRWKREWMQKKQKLLGKTEREISS